MRIAVLADIHGNFRALQAVQADLRQFAPDLTVNLGDHLSGPLQAALTADALIDADYLSINGNHDRQLITIPRQEMGPSDLEADSQINDHHRAWLRSHPATRVVDSTILLCHGTPASDTTYLLEEVDAAGMRMARVPSILAALSSVPEYELVLCGHSHVPRLISLGPNRLAINPGSVGLQAYDDGSAPFPHVMEMGSPHARYAILDRVGGKWTTQFRAVEYDWHAASQQAAAGNRPDWASALATGYIALPR
jgi:predicted phosphodiesterase